MGVRGTVLMVGQEYPERTMLRELDSITIFLWKIKHSSQAVHKNAGSDVQLVLALLSGSWAVCRVDRCQLDTGLPCK